MEHRDIEIFLTLAEELHFGRAAARLRVSTTRVSQSIKKVERRIGAPLFERTSRRVEITRIGRDLEEGLRPAFRAIADAVDRARLAARTVHGTLRVGFVGAAAGRFVLEVVKAFRIEHPGCEVSFHEKHFGAGLAPLRAGEIDLVLAAVPVFGSAEVDLSAGGVLFTEALTLAVPAAHPFAGRSSVAFGDLARTTVLRTPPTVPAYWDEVLVGEAADRGPTFTTVQEMLALVGAGFGSYPVPAQMTGFHPRPDVVYVPIDGAPPYTWRFVWRRAGSGPIQAFDRVAVRVAATGRGR